MRTLRFHYINPESAPLHAKNAPTFSNAVPSVSFDYMGTLPNCPISSKSSRQNTENSTENAESSTIPHTRLETAAQTLLQEQTLTAQIANLRGQLEQSEREFEELMAFKARTRAQLNHSLQAAALSKSEVMRGSCSLEREVQELRRLVDGESDAIMVRFKNRYILADYSLTAGAAEATDRSLLKSLKQAAEEMMGELFLAKITFSLQVKYMAMGKVLIRVPRDHCAALQACLFVVRGLRVLKVSGTIRGIQKKLYELARGELRRELTKGERDMIDRIDYS